MTAGIQKSSLGRLQEIGRGGEGRVYRAPELRLPGAPQHLVFKEYKRRVTRPHGLRAIVALRARMSQADRQRLDSIAAWPTELVFDGEDLRGVVMPLIPSAFFEPRVLPSGKAVHSLREVQHLFVEPGRAKKLGMPLLGLALRFTMCRDLAGALGFLHSHDVVFGDVNAKNAAFRTIGEPAIILVDCDAVRIKGTTAINKQLNAPDWAPPEGAVLTQATDRYKVGLFIVRTLSPGPFASTARDPQRVAEVLDREGMTLLKATLGADPRGRPPLGEIEAYFGRKLAGSPGTAPRRAAAAVVLPPTAPQRPPRGWKRDPVSRKWVPIE